MKRSDGRSETISDLLLFRFVLCAFASLREISVSEFRQNHIVITFGGYSEAVAKQKRQLSRVAF
jgi:hypothetical protein